MSSCPGHTMEDYLAWEFDLIVEGQKEVNFSVGLAEALGNVKRRSVVSQTQFDWLVALYEPYRERIEYYLLDFDEDEQSWRGYSCVFGFITSAAFDKEVLAYVESIKEIQ